jgi:hypothetical protein
MILSFKSWINPRITDTSPSSLKPWIKFSKSPENPKIEIDRNWCKAIVASQKYNSRLEYSLYYKFQWNAPIQECYQSTFLYFKTKKNHLKSIIWSKGFLSKTPGHNIISKLKVLDVKAQMTKSSQLHNIYCFLLDLRSQVAFLMGKHLLITLMFTKH